MKKTIIERFPEWALCAVINGDRSGLSDEDEAILDAFIETLPKNERNIVSDLEGTRREFDTRPAFGLACSTVSVLILS